MRGGVGRVELQGFPEVRNGFVRLAGHNQREPQVVEGLGVLGVDFQRPSVTSDGPLLLPFPGEGDSKIVVGLRGLGDRSSAPPGMCVIGLVQLPSPAQGNAQVEVSLGGIGSNLQRFLVLRDRFVQPARSGQDEPRGCSGPRRCSGFIPRAFW